MPPEMITAVIPTARIPFSATWRRMSVRLPIPRKTGPAAAHGREEDRRRRRAPRPRPKSAGKRASRAPPRDRSAAAARRPAVATRPVPRPSRPGERLAACPTPRRAPSPRSPPRASNSPRPAPPGRRAMRWHCVRISDISDEQSTIPKPSAASRAQQRVDLGLRGEVDAARRLVEQQHRRRREETPGEQRLLLVAAGERRDRHRRRRPRARRCRASPPAASSARAPRPIQPEAAADASRARRALMFSPTPRSGKIACALRSSGSSTRPASPRRGRIARRRTRCPRRAIAPGHGARARTGEREQEVRAAGADQPREADDLSATHRSETSRTRQPPGRSGSATERSSTRSTSGAPGGDRLERATDDLAADHQAHHLGLVEPGGVSRRDRAGRRAAPSRGGPGGAPRRAGARCRRSPTPALGQPSHEALEPRSLRVAERRGRLVHDDEAGVERERARDRDELPLARLQPLDRRRPAGTCVSPMAASSAPSVASSASRRSGRRRRRLAAEKDVLGGRQRRDELQLLRDHGDAGGDRLARTAKRRTARRRGARSPP